jgi:hypothetical protein
VETELEEVEGDPSKCRLQTSTESAVNSEPTGAGGLNARTASRQWAVQDLNL